MTYTYKDLIKLGYIKPNFLDKLAAGQLESWRDISILCGYFLVLGALIGAIMAMLPAY